MYTQSDLCYEIKTLYNRYEKAQELFQLLRFTICSCLFLSYSISSPY